MTAREAQILAFIGDYQLEHGYAPTTREIADAVGLASRSTVHRYLVSLRGAGHLEWEPKQTRTMRVVST